MKDSHSSAPRFVAATITVVALSILLMLAFLIFRGWATATSLSFEGPSALRATPYGTLAVVAGERIFEINTEGQLTKQTDLSALGLYGGGDVVFEPDGSFLIAQKQVTQSFSDQLLNSLFAARKILVSPLAGGIYRCNQSDCSFFADISDLNSFNLSYSLASNPHTGDIYFSSANEHTLVVFDSEGHRKSLADEGYKFPNSLVWQGDSILFPDTNNHEIKRVNVEDGSFGTLLSSYLSGDSEAGNSWPYDLEPSEKYCWVTFCNDFMSRGKIARYDQSWSRVGSVALPQDAWPLGMAWFNGVMWISDIDRFALYRVTESGTVLADFQNPILQQYFDEAREQQSKYARLADIALWLMIAALIPGFIAAYFYDRAKKRGVVQKEDINKAAEINGIDSSWHRTAPKNALFRHPWLGLLNTVVIALAYIFMGLLVPLDLEMHSIFIVLIAASYFAYEIIKLIAQTEVRLQGQTLCVRQNGRTQSALLSDVPHTNVLVVVGNNVLVFGSQKIRHFQRIDESIKNGLHSENRMTYLQSRLLLFRIGHPIPYIEAIVLLMALLMLFIEMGDRL